MARRSRVAALALLVATTGCAAAPHPASEPQRPTPQGPAPPLADERIVRFEHGLLHGRSRGAIADRMAAHNVPAVSVALIDHGAVAWARAYGVIEAGGSARATPDTLFQAGSVSKPVAAMAALKLVEEGKLALDEDVNARLTSWRVPENEFTAREKVTLRRLLSHGAGINVHGFRGYDRREQAPTLLQVLDGLPPCGSPPLRVDAVPGSAWRYSGGGFVVLQQLLIDVAHDSFPSLMKSLVLGPLGMTHSTYEQPLPEARWGEAASAHRANGNPAQAKWFVHPEMAAAGLWTTPSDMARWVIEIMNAHNGQSSKVLKSSTAAEMLKPQRGTYGLGVVVSGRGADVTFGHGGSNRGFRMSFVGYTATGQGAVVMTNGDGGGPLIDEILRALAMLYVWPDHGERWRVGDAGGVEIDDASADEALAWEAEAAPTADVVSAWAGP